MKKVKESNPVLLRFIRGYYPKVEYIVDAAKSIIVTVTPKDAQSPDIKKFDSCPLALAGKRDGKADGVLIGYTVSFFIYGKKAVRYMNGEAITREITAYDRKAFFDTGVYKLTAPSTGQRLGEKRSSGPSGKKGGNGNGLRLVRHYTKGVRTFTFRSEPIFRK